MHLCCSICQNFFPFSVLIITHYVCQQTPNTEYNKAEERSSLPDFQSASWEAQGCWRGGLRVAHRIRHIYGVNEDDIWLFQLIGCLAIFLFWIMVAEAGTQGSPEMPWVDSLWGLVGFLCWFLRKTGSSCKVGLRWFFVCSFLCACVEFPFSSWHKGLHSVWFCTCMYHILLIY